MTVPMRAPAPLMSWPDLTDRAHPAATATIRYGTEPMQLADLWLPSRPGPFPTVLMVHGGCWTTGIADRRLMDWVADDLRLSGIAVWNIDYRGVDRPGGGYPGTFADAAAAADALTAEAARLDLDTRRIVAVGHSAGGHLALWLAARRRLTSGDRLRGADPLPIHHVVSLGGLPDLEAVAAGADHGCGLDVVGRLVGLPSPARPDVYADTSVPRLLPLGVSQDLVNGREDGISPLRFATGYQQAARRSGDRVALHVVEGTGHVELIAPETPAWAAARRLIRLALAS